MSRRALLSPEQRIRLFGIPVDQAEMARHYVLSAEDLAFVRAKRRVSNRLGFAVQLCVLRYPGRALNPVEAPPGVFGHQRLQAADPGRATIMLTRRFARTRARSSALST